MKKNVALVLLAAGDSRRFQGNKLLCMVDGKAMYRHIADQAEALSPKWFCRRLIVTQYDAIAADMAERGFLVVWNPESHRGISHSIQLALEALEGAGGAVDGVLFSVCDQPYLRKETIEALLTGWEESGRGMACVRCGDKSGNPAIFSARYFSSLRELTGDTGGKRVILRYPDDVFWLEMSDPRELKDIDTRQQTDR